MDVSKLIEKAGSYQKINSKRIEAAYDFANKAHAGQTRMSGKAYIIHPYEVAMILTRYEGDEDSIIAALLHDVVEDTYHKGAEIEKLFGKSVAKMVHALTKLPKVSEINSSPARQFDYKIESIRKIFEVMQDDVRVIVIKLCDRLHNMTTLQHFRPDKQKRIAQETMDIFVKIADRLCIYDLKEKLEELSFKFLNPNLYDALQIKLKDQRQSYLKNKSKIFEKISLRPNLKIIKKLDVRQIIPYEKITRTNFESSDIHTEVFITVPKEEDCYLTLRDIHFLWKNVRGTFNDYIALPKSNGYQALESSVVKTDGSVIRFIIQTEAMYDYFRNGVLLECFSGTKKSKKIKLKWVENLKKIHEETKEKSSDYISALENDILKGSIVIYTEDNKVIHLPPKCTALDAAFSYLGKKAYKLSSVSVNQKEVLLSHHLKEGQSVHFVLSRKDMLTFKWLKYVQTAYAKSFIFSYLKKLSKANRVSIAEEMLQMELNEIEYGYLDEISPKKKKQVAKNLIKGDWEHLLILIAEGRHDPQTVISLLFDRDRVFKDKISSHILVKRTNGSSGLCDIFSYLLENNIEFVHLDTKKYDEYYIDKLKMNWSLHQRNFVYTYIREHLHYEVTELKPVQLGYISYVYLLAIPVLWSLNTFVSRYIMSEGISVTNATELRFLSSAGILFLIAYIKKVKSHEEHSTLQYPLLFFFVAGVLTLYTYLIHESLYLTESINYIVPVSISFILVALLHAFRPMLARKKNLIKIVATLFLCVLSLVLLLKQDLSYEQALGIGISGIVLLLHMTYNYFGNIYHQRYKVKSRGIILLAYSFLFSSVIFLPFTDYSNFIAIPGYLLAIAVVNGVLTGGIAHFFFFEAAKYFQHYKLTYSMSIMVALTFVLGYFLEGSGNIYSLLASIFMIMAFLVAGRYEYKKQGTFDAIRHLV